MTTRLLCDEMLGRLARWLRLLGFDTAYAKGVADAEILARARSEGRFLLTRDEHLAAQARKAGLGVLLVGSLHLPEQLEETRQGCGLRVDPAAALTRCALCNGGLKLVGRNAVDPSRLPAGVADRFDVFWRCISCAQLYWRGTHTARIVAEAERLARGGDARRGLSEGPNP